MKINFADNIITFQGEENQKTAEELLGSTKELFCLFSSMLDKLETRLKYKCFNDDLNDFPFYLAEVSFEHLKKIGFTSGKAYYFDNNNDDFSKTFKFINDEKTSQYLNTAIEKLNNVPQNEDCTVNLSGLM